MPATPPTPVPRTPPRRNCDLVMKGGITSGVVYPLAVTELATTFRFRNIGGTSAGAIAAAATAAAERGRAHGGFDRLATLPAWLGAAAPGSADSNLFSLFQPQPATRPLFRILTALLRARRRKALAAVLQAALAGWPWVVAGAAPGLVLGALAVPGAAPAVAAIAAVSSLATALLGAVVTLGLGFAFQAWRRLPGNGYGLCLGRTARAGGGAPGLTDWLHGYLNELAGKPAGGAPLTFGELWWPDLPAGSQGDPQARDIRLEMMTTNVTHGRPYALPLRDDDDVRENRRFAFDPAEFRRLFPDAVVDWMIAHARRDPEMEPFVRRGLVPLPEPWNLPVVVATRMSLSFPVLLAMVPLWSIDWSRVKPGDRVPERCWFSDGGICSNFPVHFFDAPLPRWPTFAINLEPTHPDREPGTRMPTSNRHGLAEHWNRFDGVFGFLGAIQQTMQGWSDMQLVRMPGQRDRIATVTLATGEGGLNLDMPAERITDLAQRGRRAGRLLAGRFGDPAAPGPMNWANHRWIRLRAFLAAHEELAGRVRTACERPEPGDTGYREWLRSDRRAPSYQWPTPETRAEAARRLDALSAAPADGAPPVSLGGNSPRPRPELRVRPRG